MWHWAFIFGVGILLICLELLRPGRKLPEVTGWYARAIFLNTCQLALTLFSGAACRFLFPDLSLLNVQSWPVPAQGFAAWFIGTFVFYWWHRLRHSSDVCWQVFHQIHHSPARIEVLTAFYKHPLEIFVNSLLSSAILYLLLGASLEAAIWYNIFAASGEMFYHSNLKTPRWVGWFIQRPEHHSIHHQYGVHHFNYGDIPVWDRLFGTFKEADEGAFAPRCGFDEDKERSLGWMLLFRKNS
jgi:sterol desaturase/sphingolipid hydroxylase (fatty acid hydroxylase superfamily)